MKTAEKIFDLEPWVDAHDLAAHWNKDVSWVRRNQTRIPHVQPTGPRGRYRFRISEADAWLQERGWEPNG